MAWYENDDSQDGFVKHGLTAITTGARAVNAIDMDADGDMDVLSVYANADQVAWHENDGQANFTEHFISNHVDSP